MNHLLTEYPQLVEEQKKSPQNSQNGMRHLLLLRPFNSFHGVYQILWNSLKIIAIQNN